MALDSIIDGMAQGVPLAVVFLMITRQEFAALNGRIDSLASALMTHLGEGGSAKGGEDT